MTQRQKSGLYGWVSAHPLPAAVLFAIVVWMVAFAVLSLVRSSDPSDNTVIASGVAGGAGLVMYINARGRR